MLVASVVNCVLSAIEEEIGYFVWSLHRVFVDPVLGDLLDQTVIRSQPALRGRVVHLTSVVATIGCTAMMINNWGERGRVE